MSGSGLISLLSGMKPDTTMPGFTSIGNARAAIVSAPAARSAAGMASRLARVSLRSKDFWFWISDASDIIAVMPGLVPGMTPFFLNKQDVDGRDKPGHDNV